MTEHPQVVVSAPDGYQAEVDEQLAPLIQRLWAERVDTLNSCQDNQGQVWVQFMTGMDTERFLELLGLEVDDTLQIEDWDYRAHVWNLNEQLDGDEIVPTGPPDFLLSISVRFPHEDLPAILDRLADKTGPDSSVSVT